MLSIELYTNAFDRQKGYFDTGHYYRGENGKVLLNASDAYAAYSSTFHYDTTRASKGHEEEL